MDKTVHISTYCTSGSYGSILQALGLKLALKELGYDSCVEQIGAAPRKMPIFHLQGNGIKGKLALLLSYLMFPKLYRKYAGTQRFLAQNMDTKYYANLEQMRQALREEQLFLAGSDQIWNPKIDAPQFFLEFAPEHAKKMSYAASMGILEIPVEKEALFAKRIQNLDWISVREADNISVLSKYTDADISVHIDPSFLCSKTQWQSYQRMYPIKHPYILVYPLHWDKKWNSDLKRLHELTGKPIVVLADHRRNIYGNKWLYDVDLGNFLWLIDHADAVVSSSFHGVAMAINYNKPVLPMVNPDAPSRISSLLQCLSYPDVTPEMVASGTGIDYMRINRRMAEEKERSMSFLKEMLES